MRGRSPPTGKSGVQVALPQLDALIAAKPDWPYFYEIKGQFLFESGRCRRRRRPLRKAVELAPDAPLIRIMFAQALLGTPTAQNVDEAITNLRTALAREDDLGHGLPPTRRGLRAQGARKRRGPRSSNIWRRPSLHRPRPISMKGS